MNNAKISERVFGVLVFVLLLLNSWQSTAWGNSIEEERPLGTISLGAGVMLNQATDHLHRRSAMPILIGAGVSLQPMTSSSFAAWDTRLEYSVSDERDGNVTLSVLGIRHNVLMWFNRNFRLRQRLYLYAGMGLGMEKYEVETTLAGVTEKRKGEWEFSSGLAVGLKTDLTRNFYSQIEMRGEFGWGRETSEKISDSPIGIAVLLGKGF